MIGEDLYYKLVQRKDDYERTFNTDHGRRVLHDHLKRCGVFKSTHDPDSPHNSTFNNGMREGALFLVRELGWTEADLMRMAKERAKCWRQQV